MCKVVKCCTKISYTDLEDTDKEDDNEDAASVCGNEWKPQQGGTCKALCYVSVLYKSQAAAISIQ